VTVEGHEDLNVSLWVNGKVDILCFLADKTQYNTEFKAGEV
jgi:hypothetical protein